MPGRHGEGAGDTFQPVSGAWQRRASGAQNVLTPTARDFFSTFRRSLTGSHLIRRSEGAFSKVPFKSWRVVNRN